MGNGIMSLAEISNKYRINYNTIKSWYRRQKLPTPAGQINGRPYWKEEEVERWVRSRLVKVAGKMEVGR